MTYPCYKSSPSLSVPTYNILPRYRAHIQFLSCPHCSAIMENNWHLSFNNLQWNAVNHTRTPFFLVQTPLMEAPVFKSRGIYQEPFASTSPLTRKLLKPEL